MSNAMSACRGLCFGGILAVTALTVPLPAASQTAPPSTVVFTGLDIGPNATFGYLGGMVALGRDLGRDSVVLRGFAGYGGYDYVSGADLGDIDGRIALFDAMIGYQVVRSNLRATGFVGVEYQDHRLSPDDPGNRVRGDETGFKVLGEISTDVAQPFFFSLVGLYSTAFDNYWSRLRLGYKVRDFVVGPEGVASGNEEYDAWRLGAFVQTDLSLMNLPSRLSVSGGYQKANDDGFFGTRADGGYATLTISIVY